MSAFIVDDKTINRIISWLELARDIEYIHRMLPAEYRADYQWNGHFNELGKAMFELNCRSINERYGEGAASDFRELNYQPKLEMNPTEIQVYKSLQCFLYQSCEGTCDKDPLYLALEKIGNALAHRIISNLADYEKAAWA